MNADLLAPPLFELITTPDTDGQHVGRARFDVRSFVATEAISTLFQLKISAHHAEAGLDFLEIVGAPASFRATGHAGAPGSVATRTWTGVVAGMEQTRAVGGPKAYSTYELTLVPRLWLLTQRRNYRIFQFKSELAIALEILREWDIAVDVRLDAASYRGRKYKVQYAETDYEFVYRILAEVGICFFFEEVDGESVVVLSDAPHLAPKRLDPIGFEDSPTQADGRSYVSDLRRSQRVRPASILLRDRDYRKDSKYELQAGWHAVDSDKRELAIFDRRLEGFYYPENFNFLDDGVDETTPYADARGLSRTDEEQAKRLAKIDLQSRRNDWYVVELTSNDVRLSHGMVLVVEGHPADEINHEDGLLIVESRIGGRIDTALQVSCEAVSARWPYRPTLAAKPRIVGLESATVVGTPGEEIDCDEFGRVKVHFHWDRYSKRNDESSCWIPVSQTWGGAGMGGVQIPRIGQEVLVEFLAGDPDRPIITGRVFTAVNKVPLKLPQAKTQTILQSQSTGGGGGHNMMRMEDRQGQEHLHMRAEKDKSVQVNNNCTTNVGGHRSITVGATIIEQAGDSISISAGTTVAASVSINASAEINETAEYNINLKGTQGDITVDAPVGTLKETAKFIKLVGEERITLRCGSSVLVLCPDFAILESTATYINPGPGDAEAAEVFGLKPATAADQKKNDEEFAEMDKKTRGEYTNFEEELKIPKQREKLAQREKQRKDEINARLNQEYPRRSNGDGTETPVDLEGYKARKAQLDRLYPPARSPYWDQCHNFPKQSAI